MSYLGVLTRMASALVGAGVRSAILGLVVAATASMAVPTLSRASTLNLSFSTQNCTGCSNGTFATGTVMGIGTNVLTFDLTTSTNVLVHDSGGTNKTAPGYYFDVTGAGTSETLAYSYVSGTFSSSAYAGTFGPTGNLDAFGTGNFALDCTANPPGPSNTCGSNIKFTITGAAGDLLSLAGMTGANGLGAMFGVGDFLVTAGTALCAGSTACTGPVGAATPLPGALALFAGGLGLLGFAGLGKRRKAARLAAAY